MVPKGVAQAVAKMLPAASAHEQVVQLHELLAFAYTMLGDSDRAVTNADAATALPCKPRLRSLALARWCWTYYGAGRFEVDFDTPLAEASALASKAGDLVAQLRVLDMQCMIASNLRLEYELCESLSARRQQLATQLGARAWASAALVTRAVMWAHLGRFEEAITTAAGCEALDLADSGSQNNLSTTAQQLARIYVMARRWEEATAAFCRSIRVSRQHHLIRSFVRAMLHLPNALAVGRDPETAARLHGFGTLHYERHCGRPNRIEGREICRTRRLLRIRLGVAQFEARIAEGAALTTAQAVALALAQGPKPT
jgi:tetratricopeptide (TPR) repeat protein